MIRQRLTIGPATRRRRVDQRRRSGEQRRVNRRLFRPPGCEEAPFTAERSSGSTATSAAADGGAAEGGAAAEAASAAEKVETAVMVTERSRFPPNMTVQMFEAPPPGEVPVTKRPSLISGLELGKRCRTWNK